VIQAVVKDEVIQIKILSPVTGRFKEDVEMIKAIPQRQYRDGYWYIPYEQKYNLIDCFGNEIEWQGEKVSSESLAVATKTVDIKSVINNIDLNRFKLPPFPYQVVGASFLIAIKRGILADEPGVGKTLQAIMGADYLLNEGIISKVLTISPSSVKYQWANEIAKFTNHTSVVIDGTPKKRREQFETKADFYLINYELMRQDMDLEIVKSKDFGLIILDEAHYIKDYKGKTSGKLRELKADWKWLLTGTPMQNRDEELYSLFYFMEEEVFGPPTKFKKDHLILGRKYGRWGEIVGYKNRDVFKQKIAPYIMRRTVEEVLPQMPPLIVSNYPVQLTDEQYKLQSQLRDDMSTTYDELGRAKNEDVAKAIENRLMGFRTLLTEICDSPELLSMSESKMANKYVIKSTISPKLDALETILTERLANNPALKVVIFSQFERMQTLIGNRLQKLGKCAFVNGTMKAYIKQASIDKFKYDSEIRFLICTDSANTGLNLQEASLLINIDIPWNPAVLTQRMGRIRRADSKHELLQVINLIAIDSIDERILEVIYDKQDLSAYLVNKTEADKKVVANLTKKVMNQMIKRRN
jgi:SNF2 family DNA or RNA helicase